MFKSIVGLVGCVLSGSALAVTAPYNNLIIGLSAGPTWTTGNKAQTINLEPDVAKHYTANDETATFPTVELFMGWQEAWYVSSIQQELLGQLGISIAGAGNAKLNGDIWEDADPTFDNYNYSLPSKS